MSLTLRWVAAPIAAAAALLVVSASPAAAFVGSDTHLKQNEQTGDHQDRNEDGSLPLITAADHPAGTPNWTGYIKLGTAPGQFTSVRASWTVPKVSCAPAENSFSLVWAGMDGALSQTVEQIGTVQSCNNGQAAYQAFYETFPNPGQVIPGFTVRPGDRITASVQYRGGNSFVFAISNESRERSFHTTQTTPAPVLRASGEAIFEIPLGATAPNMTRVNFSDVSINHQELAKTSPTPVLMFNPANGSIVWLPTVIDGGRFSVQRVA
jgi:hypothetical protein